MSRFNGTLTSGRTFLDVENNLVSEPRAGVRGLTFGEVRGIDADRRQVTAILSTEKPDRYDEVIVQSAWEKRMDSFLKNPVMLAGHSHGGNNGEPTVIGRWVEIGVKKVPGLGPALIGTCQFMENDDLAEKWWQRFLQGMVRAFSVGFLVHSYEIREFETETGDKKRLRTYVDIQLLEVSCVAIPAAPDALVLAASASAGRSAVDDLADGGADGISNRRLNKIIARSVGPLVERAVDEAVKQALNADPGTRLAIFIADVVQATREASVLMAPQQSSRAGFGAPSGDELDELLGDGDDLDAFEDDDDWLDDDG